MSEELNYLPVEIVMYIKRLEIQGFKSFSGRTKIVFHRGITAIVGPNGTGKSNIVDALLWVMSGKRLKALRGEQSGDIIFNGNSRTAPLNMADVSIVLSEEDEDTVITHRLFRTGEGEYRMNGKAVRLKDIQDFLWKKAVGETEYFVIEQGSIGQFLSSKPQEKRLLLEEAAGTAFYKEKKRQAQLKLENSAQNLARLEDIITEVERTQSSLKRQAQAAMRYRKLREAIRESTLFLFRKKIHRLEESQKETIRIYQKSLEKENNLIARIKSEEKNLAEKRNEVWKHEKSNNDEREKLYNLKNQLSRLESEMNGEDKRIKDITEARIKSGEEKEGLQKEILSLNKDITQNAEALQTLKNKQTSKQKTLEKINRESRVSGEDLKIREDKIEGLRGRLLQKLSIQTEKKNEAGRLEKELELIARQKEKLECRIQEERNLLSDKYEEIQTYVQELDRQRQNLREKAMETERNEAQVDSLGKEYKTLQDRLMDLDKEKDGSLHHLHALEKVLEKERRENTPEDLPGSIGILADLIETDAKDAFLVDIFWKEEAKANMIEAGAFLDSVPKDRPAGHYFLISSKKKDGFPPGLRRDSRVDGFLKARIRTDPKLRESFGQLQEAVIVDDIEKAVALWLDYPEISCLTRKGDLLLASGLLKLGPKKEGLIALGQEIRSIKEKITGIEQRIRPLSCQVQEKEKEKTRLLEEIRKSTETRTTVERTIADKEKEKKFSLTEKEKIEAGIDLNEKELFVLQEEKQDKEDKLAQLNAELEALEKTEDGLKKEVREEEDALVLLREKREEKRNLVFELQSAIDILKEKRSSTQDRIQSLKQRVQAMEAKILRLDEEIRNLDEQKTRLRKSCGEHKEKSLSLIREIGEREKRLRESESRLTQFQREQQEMENRIEEIRRAHEERKEERVQREIKKAQCERDIANCEESCWQELKKTLDEVKKEVPMDTIVEHNVEEDLSTAKEKLEKLKNVNLMAEEEYLIQKERFDFLTNQRDDLHDSIDSTQEAIRKIDQESKIQFLTALKEVNKNFKDVFQLLFEGGHAELKLTDPNHPLESGVDITAQPPGKKVQSLSLLSGGEKSLTSLAFLFGLFRYKPTPFCILDEVDAALDEVNLGRFLKLMKKIKTQTQFIIITHNFKTMEVADYIYGTTMAEPNITSLYAMKLEKKEQEKV